jgi:hypothetical protein
MIARDKLMGVVQMLQDNPAAYLGFGVYWWPVKRMLKEHFGTDVLYMLGPNDDAEVRNELEQYWSNDDELFEAACNHYAQAVTDASHLSGLSVRIDGALYVVSDDDVGPASVVLS